MLPSGPDAGHGPSILIVEDEPIIRSAATHAFASAGWCVLQAASGEVAMTMIPQHRPSVVFTDIALSGSATGWDVGAVGCAHGAKIVYTSGDAKTQALLSPSNAFFLKPYETLAVVKCCCDALAS